MGEKVEAFHSVVKNGLFKSYVIIFIGHGGKDELIGEDELPLFKSVITQRFIDHNKTKLQTGLFIVDACQTDAVLLPQGPSHSNVSGAAGRGGGMIRIDAAVEGQKAYADEHGTQFSRVFIQDLTADFKRNGDNYADVKNVLVGLADKAGPGRVLQTAPQTTNFGECMGSKPVLLLRD